MPLDWKPFVDLVKQKQHFLITTHIRPDPDGLGSQLGLADVLRGLGKKFDLVISSVWPPRYDFLDPERRSAASRCPARNIARPRRCSFSTPAPGASLATSAPFMKTLSVPKMVIDHHISQDDLGRPAALWTPRRRRRAGSCMKRCRPWGAPLTPAAANFLFAALATDTGWFRHRNTTAATYALAEKLVKAGADPTNLYNDIYEQNTLPRLKLVGRVLDG